MLVILGDIIGTISSGKIEKISFYDGKYHKLLLLSR